MGAHVFVVDKFSFPVHRSRSFCGVKNPLKEATRHSLYADINAIRKNDLVFFYQRRVDEPPEERGFRGIFQAVSEPFFDAQNVEWDENVVLGGCPFCKEAFSERDIYCPKCGKELPCIGSGKKKVVSQHILPNRVLIKPIEYFEKPVEDNTAYINHTNHGTLWTMLFRKVFGPGRERSITHILPEEAQKLIRLIKRVNNDITIHFPSKPYPPGERREVEIDIKGEGALQYEATLEAWLMRNIDRDIPGLNEIIPKEDMEYFGNNVLYGIGGDKVDGLVLYKKDVRYKAIAIELKRDIIDEGTIKQIDRYSYWIAQLSTANAEPRPTSLLLQPLVIGHRVAKEAVSLAERRGARELSIPYPVKPCRVTVNSPVLLTYKVEGNTIKFERKVF